MLFFDKNETFFEFDGNEFPIVSYYCLILANHLHLTNPGVCVKIGVSLAKAREFWKPCDIFELLYY